MSQATAAIANISRTLFRQAVNAITQAIQSLNSGLTAPTETYAYMFWADTTTGLLKQRNAANTGWIVLRSLGGAVIENEGADVAAASTTNIWADDGNTRHVTGSTGPITSFGTAPQAGAWMKLIFDGTPTLTQGANLNLNAGGSDITIEAGDVAFVYADTTTQMRVFVIRKSGQPVVSSAQVSEKYVYIRDEKAASTDGGDFTSGAYRTRTLNTKVSDAGGLATLSSNQITLAAGTYRFRGRAPAYSVEGHRCKLVNITDAIDYLGSSEFTSSSVAVTTNSFVSGRFTIATAKVFELQHRCNTTKTGNGFGNRAAVGDTEVYAEIEFWKEL